MLPLSVGHSGKFIVDGRLEALAGVVVNLLADLIDLGSPVCTISGADLVLIKRVLQSVEVSDFLWDAELGQVLAELLAVLRVPVTVLVAA